ncbi:hypothetical protein DPMN_074228 [Dreissena polymorpha]|uniref:Uncharacterized protein n=1 Tax=Dreissena polymorpha TaxID=45954 RepID=A0A9D4BN52_DREPO|nr:hypothetical protein DPMN_074228 [Dreissena polymorpha]
MTSFLFFRNPSRETNVTCSYSTASSPLKGDLRYTVSCAVSTVSFTRPSTPPYCSPRCTCSMAVTRHSSTSSM